MKCERSVVQISDFLERAGIDISDESKDCKLILNLQLRFGYDLPSHCSEYSLRMLPYPRHGIEFHTRSQCPRREATYHQ